MNTYDARTLDPGDLFVLHGQVRRLVRRRQIAPVIGGESFLETEYLHGRPAHSGDLSYARYPYGIRVEVPNQFKK